MNSNTTALKEEIAQIPQAVQSLIDNGGKELEDLAGSLAENPIPFLVSVARGSSDHACTYLKYASELLLKLPMASLGPSVASVYNTVPSARGALALAVSQSGRSPDIVQMVAALRKSGATTVAITNDPESPLAQAAQATLPIYTGTEQSVAATKTYVASVVCGLWLLSRLAKDNMLERAIRELPESLEKAAHCDWSEVIDGESDQSMFTLGRGPSWAVSNEAALKFKETCQIHAESYSSAELLHGPVSLVHKGFPVLGFAANDAAEASTADVCDTLARQGARVFVTSHRCEHAITLPHIRTTHRFTDPLALVVSFYSMIEKAAVARGLNPDQPPNLNKVTRTL